ncbi:NAD-dependent epimerase/dehydratase family protein [bacterium]|nr:NAD-dependent epimerase/dehydratase family protein [bacterium]
MKVLVTGSSGFVGHALTKRLLELGNYVVGIDNIEAESPNHLKESRTLELTSYKNFRFVKLGVLNEGVESLLKEESIDIVVDLASKDFYYDSHELLNYSPYLTTNVIGTAKIIELAKKLGAKKYIYGSTFSVYGKTKKIKFTEKKIIPKPVSPNGSSKLAGEHVVEFMSEYYNLPCVVLRIFSEYGPGMPLYKIIGHYMEKFHHGEGLKMYSSIDDTRDFIYIDDLVNYIISTFDKRLKFQVFNIASGKSYSLREIAYKVAVEMGIPKSKIKIGKSHKNFSDITANKVQADISKAVKMLKYKPQTDIDTGIRNTVKWYLETEQHKHRYHKS